MPRHFPEHKRARSIRRKTKRQPVYAVRRAGRERVAMAQPAALEGRHRADAALTGGLQGWLVEIKCSIQSRQDGVHCETDGEQVSRMKERRNTLPEQGGKAKRRSR